MAEVYLRRLSRWQAEQQRSAVADVYVTAYRGAAGAEYRDRQGFLSRFEQHVQRPGFDMVVADAGGLVGCAYGFRVDRTGEWWSGFGGELPTDIEELTASGRTFLLAELMVLPAHRRLGIATLLGKRLLSRLDADLVVAAVERPDDSGGDDSGGDDGDSGPRSAAEETLRAWGWSRLGVLDPRAVSDVGSGSGSRAGTGREAAAREVWIRRPLQ
ncbi:GNAT family N-acetyltransferase [Streptomyces albicerus]|uniref:GNAT family N-acetyltransferase n=1 Tax=Streptomyces albicerus TaxID=2569859 RepID=UPI001788C231|nr:GNAT family N-acetyltransferase [Streptomyces albicerus]